MILVTNTTLIIIIYIDVLIFRVDGSIESGGNMSSKAEISVLKGHDGTVRCLKFQTNESSPYSSTTGNSCILASGGAGDCAIRIWDIQQQG